AVTLGSASNTTGELDFKFSSGTRTLIVKGATPSGSATNTISIPYATDTLAILAGSQAFTNKDLTDATNTFPTFNQNTTGSAAKWTTARNLAGNSVDGSVNVAFSNAFIVQGTSD